MKSEKPLGSEKPFGIEYYAYNNNQLLKEVVRNSYDPIFVTDSNGDIILVNQAGCKHIGLPPEQLFGSNIKDLLKDGYYNRSTIMESMEKKKTVVGVVKSANGISMMTTSTPIIDENGDIIMVISNSRDMDLIEKFMIELDQERKKSSRYKNELEHLYNRYWENESDIVAESQVMKDILTKVSRIAKTDSSVMIYGHSGTGKEVIARYIHRKSNRSGGPFIAVNCAAIPENLIESELFGYEKGAFTGASHKGKLGLFEVADKGTILLDEIAELPLNLQPKLLRVLENNEIRRIGDIASRRVNIRIIGATNKNLKEMIANNEFREDLYYRLNVIPIKLPPLCERPDDILALASKFLVELNTKYNTQKRFSHNITDTLLSYNWPGNVRELRNVVERLFIIATGNEIKADTAASLLLFDNQEISDDGKKASEMPTIFKGTLKEATNTFQQHYINVVLEECDNRVGEAAKKLDIHRSGLYKKTHPKNK